MSGEASNEYPLTPLQRGMLIESVNSADPSLYVSQGIYNLVNIDLGLYCEAWNRIAERHASLRTFFKWNSDYSYLAQAISEKIEIDIEIVNRSGADLDLAKGRSLIREILGKDLRLGFDLSKSPLFRLYIIMINSSESTLIFSHHHLILDGMSSPILLEDLGTLYNTLKKGMGLPLFKKQPEFRSYVEWAVSQNAEEDKEYWDTMLGDAYLPTPIPFDWQNKNRRTSALKIKRWRSKLNARISSQIKAKAKDCAITPATLLIASLYYVFARHNQLNDVTIGLVVTGRQVPVDGVDRIVGMMLNTLPLRITFDLEQDIKTWLQLFQEKQQQLQLRSHASIEDIKEFADTGSGILFECVIDNKVGFGSKKFSESTIRTGGMSRSDLTLTTNTRVPLHISFESEGDSYTVTMAYREDRFAEKDIIRLSEHLWEVASSISASSDVTLRKISMVSDAEWQLVTEDWSHDKSAGSPDTSLLLHEFFENSCGKGPNEIALRTTDDQITYSELNRLADNVASYIIDHNVKSQSVIAIPSERSIDNIACLLGILKAGCIYAPYSKDLPEERLAFIFNDSLASIIIDNSDVVRGLSLQDKILVVSAKELLAYERGSAIRRSKDANCDALAYILYTSGSTGWPKGVEIPHRVAVARIQAEYIPFNDQEATCAKTTLTFVDSIWELFSAFRVGGSVFLVNQEDAKDPKAIISGLKLSAARRIVLVPTLLRAILESSDSLANELPFLEICISSGEPLTMDVVQRFYSALPKARLVNLYGATEVWDVSHKIVPRDYAEAITIGRPLKYARVLILSEGLEPVPVGINGEICVAGDYLPMRYRNNDQLNRQKFAHIKINGELVRIWRSGDTGHWNSDGEIVLTGRSDNLVKVRGMRVELEEIEAQAESLEAIDKAIVSVTSNDSLVLYYRPAAGLESSAKEVKRFLTTVLPKYMVPTFYKEVDEFSLTVSGKINRRDLPTVEESDIASDDIEEVVLASTDTELTLTKIWRKVLERSVVSANDNFFDIGGHSILALRASIEIKKLLGIALPLNRLFEYPILKELARYIDRESSETDLKDQIEHSDKSISYASLSQKGLWIASQLGKSKSSFTVVNQLKLDFEINQECLIRAISFVVARQKSLRVSFEFDNDVLYQIDHTERNSPNFESIDLAQYISSRKHLSTIVSSFYDTEWDLRSGFLYRIALCRMDKNEYALVIGMHHIITDGSSMGIFNKELLTAYKAFENGKEPSLPELKVDYTDFSNWQHNSLKSDTIKNQLEFWRDKLYEVTPSSLPYSSGRKNRGRAAAQKRFELDSQSVNSLKQIAKKCEVTTFIVFLATFKYALHRASGASDILIGTPATTRNREELSEIIGLFVNILIVRSEISDHLSLSDLLKLVNGNFRDAFVNSDIPFDVLVEELNPERDLFGQTFFKCMFVYENLSSVSKNQLSGNSSISFEETNATSTNYDVVLQVQEFNESCKYLVQYNSSLFCDESIELFIEILRLCISKTLSEPDKPLGTFNLLPGKLSHKLIYEDNCQLEDYEDPKDVLALILDNLESKHGGTALVANGREYTWSELVLLADSYADVIRKVSLSKKEVIALLLTKGEGLVPLIIACLILGHPMVIIDPEYPSDRISYIISDSNPCVIISTVSRIGRISCEDRLILDIAQDFKHDISLNLNNNVCLPRHISRVDGHRDMAFIVYTSGTTGKPKGVMISRGNISALVRAQSRLFELTQDSKVLSALSPSFDAGLGEMMRALCSGATLIVERTTIFNDSKELADKVEKHSVTHVGIPPAVLAQIPVSIIDKFSSVKVLVTAGEALSPDVAVRWGNGRSLITGIGHTENTVGSTIAKDWDLASPPPLGNPLPFVKAYVLNTYLQPVPPNVPGELYLAGPQVTLGYRNLPDLTSKKFINNPYADSVWSTLYRTGDIVKKDLSNHFLFVGRNDFQVKIRGYRIELQEVEKSLLAVPGVKHCCVCATSGNPKRLVAFYVATNHLEPDHVREFLSNTLPDYMVPSRFVCIDKIPLTPNNKIDRKYLFEQLSHISLDEDLVPPSTDLEAKIADIWSVHLGLEKVCVEKSFFALGGDSILLVSLLAKMNEAGFLISAPDFLAHQSVRGISSFLSQS